MGELTKLAKYEKHDRRPNKQKKRPQYEKFKIN